MKAPTILYRSVIRPFFFGALAYLVGLIAIKWLGFETIFGWQVETWYFAFAGFLAGKLIFDARDRQQEVEDMHMTPDGDTPVGQHQDERGEGELIPQSDEQAVSHSRHEIIDGHGTYVLPDGSTYVGHFKGGLFHGQGSTYRKDGSIEFEGGWKHGEFTGGTYTPADGSRYVGGWKNGERHGKGTSYYSNGCMAYQGGFRNGRFHGQGTAYRRDGTKMYEGEWCNGEKGPCK